LKHFLLIYSGSSVHLTGGFWSVPSQRRQRSTVGRDKRMSAFMTCDKYCSRLCRHTGVPHLVHPLYNWIPKHLKTPLEFLRLSLQWSQMAILSRIACWFLLIWLPFRLWGESPQNDRVSVFVHMVMEFGGLLSRPIWLHGKKRALKLFLAPQGQGKNPALHPLTADLPQERWAQCKCWCHWPGGFAPCLKSTHTHVHTLTHRCTNTQVCIHTCSHIHSDTHAYTHTHTHIPWAQSLLPQLSAL
jgi:hypothetical protein